QRRDRREEREQAEEDHSGGQREQAVLLDPVKRAPHDVGPTAPRDVDWHGGEPPPPALQRTAMLNVERFLSARGLSEVGLRRLPRTRRGHDKAQHGIRRHEPEVPYERAWWRV